MSGLKSMFAVSSGCWVEDTSRPSTCILFLWKVPSVRMTVFDLGRKMCELMLSAPFGPKPRIAL